MKQLLIDSMFRKYMFRNHMLIFRNHMLKHCLVWLVLLLSLNVNAIEVNNLYSATVAVDSYALSDRNKGLKNALRVVFIKIGGKKITHPLFSQAIKNYNKYVNQYQYVDNKKMLNDDDIYLSVSFNEKKIKQLFKQSDLAIWGRLRPQVMVWVVQENGFKRELVSSTSNSAIPATITKFSQLRGLPLAMPIMDLTDLSALNLTDVWGRFSEPVAQASMRYLAEAVVMIRISNSSLVAEKGENASCQPLCNNNALVLDWSLMTDAQQMQTQVYSEQYQGDDTVVMLNQALSDVTEIIYQKYALSTTSNNELYIDVANIDSLTSLKAVSDYLEELSAVESMQLVSAQGSNRRFKLSLIGSAEALLTSLKLSKLLNQHIDPLAGTAANDEVMVFYWGDK